MELVRRQRDVRALLLLRDEDDGCPRLTGPLTAEWLRRARLPFPSAAVLFRREFETLFLPCVARMAGQSLIDPRGVARPGLKEGTTFDGDAEAIRDAKGWLSARYMAGRYKPALDQLALTRFVSFDDLRRSRLPSFGTLERALRFLASNGNAAVYPPVAG